MRERKRRRAPEEITHTAGRFPLLYCHCARGGPIPPETRKAVLQQLIVRNVPFDGVPDMCLLAERGERKLLRYRRFAACYERAVRWLLGIAEEPLEVLNMRTEELTGECPSLGETHSAPDPFPVGRPGAVTVLFASGALPEASLSAAALLEAGFDVAFRPNSAQGGLEVLGPVVSVGSPPGLERSDEVEVIEGVSGGAPGELVEACKEAALRFKLPEPDPWISWFPVLDRSRCTDCGKCLEFCLFQVFVRSENGTIEVANPRNCKTNCPACARVCPQVAIIFPKYRQNGPYCGGNPEGASAVDIDSLLGGDIYEVLKRRSKKRFSSEPRQTVPPCSCIADMARALDIPQEVIDAVDPSKSKACACEGSDCGDGGSTEGKEEKPDRNPSEPACQ